MTIARRLSRGQWALSVALVSYTVVYAAWTWLHWWGDPVVVSDAAPFPLVATAAFLLWRRSWRRSALSRATRFLAVACSCWLVGDAAWFYIEVITGKEPFPSVADVFYLAFYPLAFLGLLAVPVRARRQRDALTLALDALTVAVAALMVLWYLIIGPTIAESGGSWLSTTLAVGYPIGDLILVLGVARVLLRRPTASAEGAMRVLLCGIGSLVIADVAFAFLELNGNYDPGSMPDTFWALGFLGVALAAVCMRFDPRTTVDVEDERARLTALPFAGTLVGLGVLALQAGSPRPGALVPLIVSAAVLGVVLVARQSVLQRDHERNLSELERLANTDPLTGLFNRRHFFEAENLRVAKALERGETIAVLVCDIDDFKLINDVYGHATGDAVLRALADRCRRAIRSTDIVARLGGDEFALILVGCTTTRAQALAATLGSVSMSGHENADDHVMASVSVGVAISDQATPLEQLLHDADAHLYDTKRAKKRRVTDPRFSERERSGG